MSIFPRRDVDVMALNEQMIQGLNENVNEFPSANTAALQSAMDVCRQRLNEQVASRALARMATEAKQQAFEHLGRIMRDQLKLAEVDANHSDQLLSLIGWGAHKARQAPRIPGQPKNLAIQAQLRGQITLQWDPPSQESGGAVRTYVIERREENVEAAEVKAAFSDWLHVGVALETNVQLVKQPLGLLLEYRVLALNTAGQSTESNTVAALL